MTDLYDHAPLTPAVLYILLALAQEDKHGYAIMSFVKQATHGNVKMGNGTLYGCIKRMLADALIADAGDRVDPDATRRKYYRLTDRGRAALHAEMQRYVETVALMRRQQIFPDLAELLMYS
jgi:DNA-binding PadR family transcriptional regulator